MKKMPKNLLDELIEATRAFWNGDDDALELMKSASIDIQERTGLCFTASWDLVSHIIKPHGFYPGADNEIIYSVLRVLGWEVTE